MHTPIKASHNTTPIRVATHRHAATDDVMDQEQCTLSDDVQSVLSPALLRLLLPCCRSAEACSAISACWSLAAAPAAAAPLATASRSHSCLRAEPRLSACSPVLTIIFSAAVVLSR